jgi:hypothetical protein
MISKAEQDLKHIEILLLDFISRLKEFDEKRSLDPNGYSDFVKLAESINRIQENLKLPRLLKCETQVPPSSYLVATKDSVGIPKEILKIWVWDPHSDKKGIMTALPRGGWRSDGRSPGNKFQIEKALDYLERSVKFIQDAHTLAPQDETPQTAGQELRLLNRMLVLLDELDHRFDRFNQPVFDLNGVNDIESTSRDIERLQVLLSLPSICELRVAGKQNVVKFKVFDPHFPEPMGTQGGIVLNSSGDPIASRMNEINLPVVRDYISRSQRFIKQRIALTSDELGKESKIAGAPSPKEKSVLEWTYAVLTLILGDPKSRMPMFLLALGASGIFQQWWLPLVHAIVVDRFHLSNARLNDAESTAFWGGLVFCIIGLCLWIALNWERFAFPQILRDKKGK